MSINLLKKLVSSVVQPEIARPEQRKPPQRVRTIDASSALAAELSGSGEFPGSRIPECVPQNGPEKISIPATWNEVIGNPQVWAEIRPVIVDED